MKGKERSQFTYNAEESQEDEFGGCRGKRRNKRRKKLRKRQKRSEEGLKLNKEKEKQTR